MCTGTFIPAENIDNKNHFIIKFLFLIDLPVILHRLWPIYQTNFMYEWQCKFPEVKRSFWILQNHLRHSSSSNSSLNIQKRQKKNTNELETESKSHTPSHNPNGFHLKKKSIVFFYFSVQSNLVRKGKYFVDTSLDQAEIWKICRIFYFHRFRYFLWFKKLMKLSIHTNG